jgi:hypothetical protein
MYENGNVRPVETIPGMRGGEIKENAGGVNSTITYCKNFGKCHNVPPVQQKSFLKIKKEEDGRVLL